MPQGVAWSAKRASQRTEEVYQYLEGRLELQHELLQTIQKVCLALYTSSTYAFCVFFFSAAVNLRDKRNHVARSKSSVGRKRVFDRVDVDATGVMLVQSHPGRHRSH